MILTRLPILAILFNIILYSVIKRNEYTQFKLFYYSGLLIFSMIQNLLFFFIFHKEVHLIEDHWNKMEIMRFRTVRSGVHASSVKISNLKVGDLVYLKGDSVSPADILVIDSSNQRHSDKIFHVSERRITGDNKIMTKVALKNFNANGNVTSESATAKAPTQGGDYKRNKSSKAIPVSADRLIKKMFGYIEYDAPSPYSDFGGSFKLKNDPKTSRISKDNVLFCGTKLYSGW
jgi:magnesium-transporting ATPase (P-type)